MSTQEQKKIRKLLKLELSAPSFEKDKTAWRLPNGEFHREFGPAIEYKNGVKCWFENGRRHNAKGPAYIYPDGKEEYWIDGEQFSHEEFIQWIEDDYAEEN